MESRDKRDLGIVGAGAATGGVIGAGRSIIQRIDAKTEVERQTDEILKHLSDHGITTKHRIAVIGLPGSGKSSISKALKRKGFKHIPLDHIGDEESARLAHKGFPEGSVVDHTLALRKTGGGHYDAVIKMPNLGPETIRKRLVQRGQGAQRMYNRIDYGRLNDEISSDFNRLHGKQTYLKSGAAVTITKGSRVRTKVRMRIDGPSVGVNEAISNKELNKIAIPITGSDSTWKSVHYHGPRDPIKTGEIIRARPEFHGAAGTLIGGGLVGGLILARRKLDKQTTNMSSDSTIIRLGQISKDLDHIINFAGGIGDPSAGQFGGTDPGIMSRIASDNTSLSALQRLKLKIAKLRGMGLYNYSSNLDAIVRLRSLNSHLEFAVGYYDDDRSTIGDIATGAGVGAGVAGVGVGGYLAHQAIKNKYGTRLALPSAPGAEQPGPGGFVMGGGSGPGAASTSVSTGQAYKEAASDIASGIKQKVGGAATIGKQAYETIGNRGGSALEQISGALRKAGKYLVRP